MSQGFNTLAVVVGTLCLGLCGVLADPGSPSWWDRHVESISCVRPGYFVNPANCHSFYRCVDRSTWNKPALQRYDFTCPTGMVFDQAFSVCTKPGSNGCADPWWPGSGENSGRENSNPSSGSSGGGSSLERPSVFSPGGRSPGDNNRPSTGRGGPFGGSGSRDPLDTEFDSPSGETSTKPSADFGLFNGGNSPFGGNSGSGGDPLDSEFGASPENSRPDGNSITPPSLGGKREPEFGSRGPFGGSSSGSGKDPLDFDFGSSTENSGSGSNDNSDISPFPSSSNGPVSRPASGSRGPLGGGSDSAGDPLDFEFGSSPENPGPGSSGNSNDIPNGSSSGQGNRPAPGSRGPFGGNRASANDPLDTDFGSSQGSSEPGSNGNSNDLPAFQSSNRGPGSRPGTGSRSPFGNDQGRDPFDNEFGTPSGNTRSREDSSSRSNEAGGNNRSGGSGPNSGSNESGGSWWGTNTNTPPKWDRNDVNPNSIEFDNWESNVSPQTSSRSPSGATWGGAPRPSNPSLDSSPWRPTGPWGSDSFNDLGSGSSSPSVPQSPPPPSSFPSSPGRPSWWDPPFAMPYQGRPSPVAANPRGPPDPWNFPYRPRYPSYQIVAYPTWPPGPYNNRNPIIVVYSNSRK